MRFKYLLLILTICISLKVFCQVEHFYDAYHFNNIQKGKKAELYKNIEGSPYLNDSFVVATIYLKDSTVYQIPTRYNLYSNKMQYMMDSVVYDIENPEAINKIELKKMEFVYLQIMKKPSFYEIVVSGKAFLIQKRAIKFEPEESPAPYTTPKPDRFENEKDDFFISVNNSEYFEVINLKTVLKVLQDQKSKLETFIKQEKIKNSKKENLIKLINYYNSL
jgi:hypothetical protein